MALFSIQDRSCPSGMYSFISSQRYIRDWWCISRMSILECWIGSSLKRKKGSKCKAFNTSVMCLYFFRLCNETSFLYVVIFAAVILGDQTIMLLTNSVDDIKYRPTFCMLLHLFVFELNKYFEAETSQHDKHLIYAHL